MEGILEEGCFFYWHNEVASSPFTRTVSVAVTLVWQRCSELVRDEDCHTRIAHAIYVESSMALVAIRHSVAKERKSFEDKSHGIVHALLSTSCRSLRIYSKTARE